MMATNVTLVDRVKIFITSSGTGPFTLGGPAPGFRGSEALVDGTTYSYAVGEGFLYEVGTCVYVASSNQMVRSPELSSNGNAAVAFPVNATLALVARAADLIATGGTFPIINSLGNSASAAIAQQAATVAINAKVTASTLAGNGGAGLVGTTGGGTVQAALDNALSAPTLAENTGAGLVGTTGGITVQAALDNALSAPTLAANTGAAAVGTADGITAQAALDLRPIRVTSRTVMKALNVTRFALVELDDTTTPGRSGWWALRSGTAPTDSLEGLYVVSNTAGYYWARIWDNITGYPAWYGAVANDNTVDNSAAINACILACPVSQLGSGDYYIGNSGQSAGAVCISMVTNGRVLRGVSETQDDLAPNNSNRTATKLILTNGYASGIRIGQASNPGGSVPSWVEHVVVENLSIIRNVTIQNPASGFANAPCGLIMQWANLCEVRNVWVKENTIGFYSTATVACRYTKCRSLRYLDAANPSNDFFAGFFQNNDAPSGFNSGNASLYYDDCGAFSNESAGNTYTYCAGLQMYQGFTDTFVTKFETVNCGYGIDAAGRSSTALDWHTEDLIIRACVLDGCRFAGIRISTTGPRTAAQIIGGYIGSTVATGPSSIGVHIYESHGAVTITSLQAIVANANPATGLLIENSSGVSGFGNQWVDFQDPIRMVNSVWCRLTDRVMQASQTVATAGVQLTASNRNVINCDVASSNSSITLPCGVSLNGTANTYNEVNCSGIYGPSMTGGSANKLQNNGTQITATGAFGTGNLASGVMA